MTEDDRSNDIVDIEAHAKAGTKPPKAALYRIRVDKENLVVPGPMITGRAILEKAGKNPPERYRLDEKLRGGSTKKIELDDTIDLSEPGVERFMTLPLDQTEGCSTTL
jgi:hypothetical protein